MLKNFTALSILIVLICSINFTTAQNQKKSIFQASTFDAQQAIDNGTIDRCGIDAVLERIYNDPDLLRQYEDNKKPYSSISNANSRIACTAANTVNIPLAFHFDNSFDCGDASCMLSEIEDAINTLNVDFGDNTGSPNAANCTNAYPDISTGTCINFYLAAPPACSG